jgi:hypothetical protein
VTRLRKMMLEELERPNYSGITTRNYLRVVTEFANYLANLPIGAASTNFEPTKPICCESAS